MSLVFFWPQRANCPWCYLHPCPRCPFEMPAGTQALFSASVLWWHSLSNPNYLLFVSQWFLNLGLNLKYLYWIPHIYCEVKLVHWIYGQQLFFKLSFLVCVFTNKRHFSSYPFWFVCLLISLGRDTLSCLCLPFPSNPSTPLFCEDCSCDTENVSVLAWWVEMGKGLGLLRDLPNAEGKPVYLNQIMSKSLGEIRDSQNT